MPCAFASSANARPISVSSVTSQVDASAAAVGKHVAGTDSSGDHQGGNPQPFDRLGVPEIAAGEQRALFLEGELREKLGNLLFGEHCDSNPDRYGPEYGMVWLNGRRRGGASRCPARRPLNRFYNYIMFLIGHLGRWEECRTARAPTGLPAVLLSSSPMAGPHRLSW